MTEESHILLQFDSKGRRRKGRISGVGNLTAPVGTWWHNQGHAGKSNSLPF